MTLSPALHSFAYALDYLREQVADVPDADMTAHPKGIMNHPAWVIGHLSFTCQMLGGAIGMDPWLPADFATRFGTGSVPCAEVSVYPTKANALATLANAQARITRAVEQLTEAQLDMPFPEPSLLDVFPSIRHALTQVLVGHTSLHLGQVSVWRKAMGLPPMRRSFE